MSILVKILRNFNLAGAQLSRVKGEEYSETPNSTGVRDYIHVVDLAKGQLRAFPFLLSSNGILTLNLSRGRYFSILEMISDLKRAFIHKVYYSIYKRRQEDNAQCYAYHNYAKPMLRWSTQFAIDRMCEDAWLWHSKNNQGF